MQQTEKYKLNKPESTDTFSVSPLNENADTLEAQLARLDGADAAETAARTAETAALDQRVTLLEAKKVVAGSYIGNADSRYYGVIQTIELGFAPIAVLVSGIDSTMALPDCGGVCVKLTQTGFQVHNNSGLGAHMNEEGRPYRYLAFG